jgi:hypothetical protein
MKIYTTVTKITLPILFMAYALIASAQQQILIVQSIQPCSKGEQPSYQLLVPQAKLKTVETAWKQYLKNKSKGKPEEQNGEWIIYGAVNKNVAPEGFNVFSKLLETTEGVILTAWFMRSDSSFISRETAADKTLAVEKYLHDFAVIAYREAVKDELAEENKKLSALENDLEQLIKDEEKANKKINEAQRSINRTKTEIRTNENDQKLKSDQIAKQKLTVESLKSTPGEAQKKSEKTLKQMENELKKLINANEKLHKQIDKWEKEIREEGRNIEKSKQDQYQKRSDIDKQKFLVKSLTDKLNNIK